MEANDFKRALAEHAREQKASQTKSALLGLLAIILGVPGAFVLLLFIHTIIN